MHVFDWSDGIRLGLLLAAALIAGKMAKRVHLPKVTAFLLVGLAMGPSLMSILDANLSEATLAAWKPMTDLIFLRHSTLEAFEPLTELAIALVLFNLGCNFPLVRLRRIFRRAVRLSFGELSCTFLLVTVGVFLIDPHHSWQGALLLGALALATAPATTILVLKETESEGQVTEFTNALVALNNLASIVLFELIFLGIYFFYQSQTGSADAPPWNSMAVELNFLMGDLFGSVLLGAFAGLTVSITFSMIDEERRLVLLLAVLMLVLGFCRLQGMPYLLAFLAMGVTVANTSEHTRQILSELDRVTGLLCVVFFVAHGAELQIDKLGQAGLVGLGYLVFRIAGKLIGTKLAALRGKEERVMQKHLGTTLLAQAGAAIALSAVAVERSQAVGGEFAVLCEQIQIVILGTVAIFELIGPIMIQRSVIQAGEVPLANAVDHPSELGIMDTVRGMFNRVAMAFGFNPWEKREAGEIKVRELLRTNEKPLGQTATFDQVIYYIEHSRNNTYPVVGENDELVGMIRYQQLSTVLFDPTLGSLVRAADIATTARQVLHLDQSALEAYELFEKCKDDCLPVVTLEEPYQLLGMIRRRDILKLLLRKQLTSDEV